MLPASRSLLRAVPLCFYDPRVVLVGANVCKVKNARVVRYDNRRAIRMNGVAGDQLHDGFPGRVIKRGSRLVADDQPRLVHQSPRDRDAWFFASGQRTGHALAPPLQPPLLDPPPPPTRAC